MNKFNYVLSSIVNIIGIGSLISIGFVALFQYPIEAFNKLSELTTTAFWLFFSFWCIALILNAQEKYDKQRKETTELMEILKRR
ncbi:MAG TPA: hypothetical protein PLT65_05545 [Bacilli bacterium]|nr:hypothetical protein [Bacilli bacterium]